MSLQWVGSGHSRVARWSCVWLVVAAASCRSGEAQDPDAEGDSSSIIEVDPSADAPERLDPTPSERQLAWHRRGFYAFVHFGMNTFTDVEWGHGDESTERFAPTALDCGQWVRTFKSAGMTGVILTVKHHDGFCLWDSAVTEHDTAASPYGGDVLRELQRACDAEGMALGVYISPWDRNHPSYGKDDAAYNDFFATQLTELLTGYGPLFEVWWDGANGDRGNAALYQEYDWDRFIGLVRSFQPDAVMFSDTGPDIRWIGNEHGFASPTQWSTMHHRPMNPGSGDPTQAQLVTGEEGGDRWIPGEVDVSIRSGWFFHPDQEPKSLDHLLRIYHESVGHNANLLLNVPPDRRGLIHPPDVERLAELGRVLRATYGDDLATGASVSSSNARPSFPPSAVCDGDEQSAWATDDDAISASLVLDFGADTTFDRVLLQEQVSFGQRVRAWTLSVRSDEEWAEVASGTTIGQRRIVRLGDAVTGQALKVSIDDARASPVLSRVGVFLGPARVTIQAREDFLDVTDVQLVADQPGCVVHYTLDGTEPTRASPKYDTPFPIDQTTRVRAVAERDGVLSPLVSHRSLRRWDGDLRQPHVFVRAPDPGLRYVAYADGGWQTLNQLAEQAAPTETGIAESLSLDVRSRDEHVALVYDGYLRVPDDGVYRLSLASDDGSRLWLHDELLIDHDGLHGMTVKEAAIGLRAGWHPVRLAWFNATGAFGLQLEMTTPGDPMLRPITPDQLAH